MNLSEMKIVTGLTTCLLGGTEGLPGNVTMHKRRVKACYDQF